MLLARINEKKIELENLRELRDLSAGLAGQMSVLEDKLATLSNGTEGMLYMLETPNLSDLKGYRMDCECVKGSG